MKFDPRIFISVIVILTLTGCVTSDQVKITSILDQYKTNVDLTDGVNEAEAQLIAQKRLIDERMASGYQYAEPMLQTDFENMPHQENYWFVFFSELEPSTVPLGYMVVIEKATGKVKFSKDYFPGKEWMIEAAIFGNEKRSY